MAKSVNQIDIETGEVIKVWESGESAAEALSGKKSNSSSISACAHGKERVKTALGFRWAFAKEIV